ncbi:hypothetical protein AX15_007419 [Amanita polypyramis BW_CC]|nr:hypothetical protein AX15_007419 [Amanita polypyramis BW_CC]
MTNTRLTHELNFISSPFLDDLDIAVWNMMKHVFKAWLNLFYIPIFFVSPSDGLASRTRSKTRITSHPPTPSPAVSSQGVSFISRGRTKGQARYISRSIKTPEAFINPPRAIKVLETVVPRDLHLRDDDYYTALVDTIAAPSQDDIEEHQVFITNIYKIIEGKLEEENDIFLAGNVEVNDEKWSPLAPDADIPLAEIIDQAWAQSHSHSEFLCEQARLNNKAVAAWQVWWTVNPPDIRLFLEEYQQWSKLDDYCRVATQTWYNIRFKELKEITANSLNLDLITLRDIKTSMEWLADELEQAGKNPKFAAQQAVERAESVVSSKQVSQVNLPVIERRLASPKVRLRSVDAIFKAHPTTPENTDIIDIQTPTP